MAKCEGKSKSSVWKERVLHKLSRKSLQCDKCGEANPLVSCGKCCASFYCSEECKREHKAEHDVACQKHLMMLKGMRSLEPDPSLSCRKAMNDTCAICTRWPMATPVVLPCRHAFCQECLQGWKAFTRRNITTLEDFIGCPTCNAPPGNSNKAWPHKCQLLASRGFHTGTGDDASENTEEDIKQEEWKDEIEEHLAKRFATDKPDILDYFHKAELQLVMREPLDAIETIDNMLSLDKERYTAVAPLEALSLRRDIAEIKGDTAEVDRLEDALIKEYKKKKRLLGTYLQGGETRVWQPLLLKGQALEALEQWDDAAEIYVQMLHGMKGAKTGSPEQQHGVFCGLARALYHEKAYKMAIGSAGMSIALDRHHPGAYQCTALCLRELDDLDGAIRVMKLAAFYETPWDEENRKAVLELYDALVEEKEQNKRKKHGIPDMIGG